MCGGWMAFFGNKKGDLMVPRKNFPENTLVY